MSDITFDGFSEDGVFFTLAGKTALQLAQACGAVTGWEPIPGRSCTIHVTIDPQPLTEAICYANIHGDQGDRTDSTLNLFGEA